mmetsp:Transcript_30200/g.76296  ORF Transcript_30200/g.76296 Transcript_30200/m.76296 type:complete len:170 (+) Transcript_30200:69-578(+)
MLNALRGALAARWRASALAQALPATAARGLEPPLVSLVVPPGRRAVASSAPPSRFDRAHAGTSDSASSDATGAPETRGWGPRLRLRGLPFRASEEEIRRFFDGFELDSGVGSDGFPGRVEILLGDKDGLPTSEALVYFGDWEEAARAREHKQRGYLRNRWVEMYVDWSP